MTPLARFAAKAVAVMVTFAFLFVLGASSADADRPRSFSPFTLLGIAGVILMWFAYFFATEGDNRRLAGTLLLGATVALALTVVVGTRAL